jgi:hypothetical protein
MFLSIFKVKAFRRIFGLICIGRRFLNKNKNSNSNSTNDDVDHIKSHEEKRSDGEEENDEGLTLNIKSIFLHILP